MGAYSLRVGPWSLQWGMMGARWRVVRNGPGAVDVSLHPDPR